MATSIYKHTKTFTLESGKKLRELDIAYTTYGTLNSKKDNVIWVCHALTANSDVFEWWKGLFGANSFFNPKEHFIICANIIGSPYGSTNPLSENPATGLPYYLSFPQFTVRDLAQAHKILADHLKIQYVSILIGGSLGGQQAMEWAITNPERIKKLILIATNAQHSPWGIAFNESQRMAITTDRTFYANTLDGGMKGLETARSIALLSYRTCETYSSTQLEANTDKTDDFKASSYQNYQGKKLVSRFNAYSYWFLTKAMDSHNVGRKRSSVQQALSKITAKTLVVGINSDILFPVHEQRFLAEYIPSAKYTEINSLYGHDGFLIETQILAKELVKFIKSEEDMLPVVTALHKIA